MIEIINWEILIKNHIPIRKYIFWTKYIKCLNFSNPMAMARKLALACWPAGRGAWERGERGIVSKFKISKQNKKAARKKRIKKGLCVGFIRGIYIVERRISAEFPQRVSWTSFCRWNFLRPLVFAVIL